MSNYNDQLDWVSEYLSARIDIIANDPKRWLFQTPYQLPTFEYFVQNCLNDKGGTYDFMVRRYSTAKQVIPKFNRVLYFDKPNESKELVRYYKHSIWMGTPFNYEEVIHKKAPN